MVRLTGTDALIRAAAALLLAALIGVRLLAPPGFMPAFNGGAVAIVACPDAHVAAVPPSAHGHHGAPKLHHQPCPYAAAASLGALAVDFQPLLIIVALFAAVALPHRTSLPAKRQRVRFQPPSRAPPLPA